MTATSSMEILQKLIENSPQGKEATAAQSFLNEYEDCNQKLSEFDEDKQVSELEYIKWLKNCRQVALLNIHALALFVQSLDREEVLRHISNKHWIKQHEILTRWAWMTSQKEEIKKKRSRRKITSFNHLYLCQVGRKVRRKTLDREFDTFRLFLPGYCEDTETEYWFYEKPCDDPPDFVAADKQGNKIGIEITEAPLNKWSSYQEKQGEIVRQKLEEDFPGVPITIDVDDQSNWSELLKNYEELKGRLDKGEDFCNYNFKIRTRAKSKSSGIITGMPRSFGNTVEHKASKAICKAIQKKVEKNSTPKIKPCILVIYENTDLMIVDKRLVADLVSENLEARWQNLYEGVWLVIRGCVFKICE